MSVEGMINVPADVASVARALDRHPDFRVLRRLPPFERREEHGFRTGVMTGVALDVETTGLDPREDRVIELAIRPFDVDAQGRIVSVGRMEAYLEDPGVPVTPEITKVTGLTQDDVRGRRIRDAEAATILVNADFVVSHNARFDRPFIDRRLPDAAKAKWACSLTDVDWRGLGFEGRTQSQLIAGIGGFYDAHRASVDVNALLHLLDHSLPDGRTVLSVMLERARRPTFRLTAHRAPRAASGALKGRGWRWSPDLGAWTIEVDGDRRDEEAEWATIHVYAAADCPAISPVDWSTRHAG